MANDGTVKIGVEFEQDDVKAGFKTVQNEGKKVVDSLKRVNEALKIDPKNIELLVEKQRLLQKSTQEAEEKVSDLSKAMEQASEAGMKEKDAAMYQVLAKALEKAKEEAKQSANALEDVTRQLEECGDHIESLADSSGMDSLSSDIQNAAQEQQRLTDAVSDTESELNRVKSAANQANKALEDSGGFERQFDDLNDEIDETTDSLKDAAKAADEFNDELGSTNSSGLGTVDVLGGIQDGFSNVAEGFTITKGAISGLVSGGISQLIGMTMDAIEQIWNLDEATEELRENLGKLDTAFEAAGYNVGTAREAYENFFAILGDSDTATEASQLLAQLANSEEDMVKWIEIAAGVYATFGDALPIEGLIEAANETAKTGQVTGVLADAINWVGMSEDELNESLSLLNDEQQRAALIMNNLGLAYGEASELFYENNEALIESRRNQAETAQSIAEMGESIAKLKNSLADAFGPTIKRQMDVAKATFDLLASAVDGIASALEWMNNQVENAIDFWSDLFGISKKATGSSAAAPGSSGRSASPRSAAPQAARMAAPQADSPSVAVGDSSALSGYAAISAREFAALESAIPHAQQRVAIATAEMAPAAGYSAPPTMSEARGAGNSQQTPVIVRPNIVLRFEGDLAQLGQVLKPVIDAEDDRVGQGV